MSWPHPATGTSSFGSFMFCTQCGTYYTVGASHVCSSTTYQTDLRRVGDLLEKAVVALDRIASALDRAK